MDIFVYICVCKNCVIRHMVCIWYCDASIFIQLYFQVQGSLTGQTKTGITCMALQVNVWFFILRTS